MRGSHQWPIFTLERIVKTPRKISDQTENLKLYIYMSHITPVRNMKALHGFLHIEVASTKSTQCPYLWILSDLKIRRCTPSIYFLRVCHTRKLYHEYFWTYCLDTKSKINKKIICFKNTVILTFCYQIERKHNVATPSIYVLTLCKMKNGNNEWFWRFSLDTRCTLNRTGGRTSYNLYPLVTRGIIIFINFNNKLN